VGDRRQPGGWHAAAGGGGRVDRLDPRAVAAATPADRDRYADFLRVASMLVVVLGHWLMTAVAWEGGRLVGTNVLGLTPGLWLATWIFQVMPVFFFVGGFANLRALDSLRRRGGDGVEFVASRAARLLRPVAVFVAVWLALPPLLTVAGVPAGEVRTIAKLLPQPLWFLAVYLVVVALAPAMARLHRRFGVLVPVALALAAAGVDLLRLGLHVPSVGYLNLVIVWLAVHQLGFLYADGTLARLPRRGLLAMAAGGLGALAVLVASRAYPPSMVTLPGATESNMNPPTICMLALAVWQVALVMLARRPATAWLARARPWTAVVAGGSVAMTVYLWQMTALVALLGVVAAGRLPLPAPGTAAWWLSRPLWLAALAALLAPLVLAFARWERRAPRPAGQAGPRARAGRPRSPRPRRRSGWWRWSSACSGWSPAASRRSPTRRAARCSPCASTRSRARRAWRSACCSCAPPAPVRARRRGRGAGPRSGPRRCCPPPSPASPGRRPSSWPPPRPTSSCTAPPSRSRPRSVWSRRSPPHAARMQPRPSL
jgi:peptidoglycan/LPS O-acetylase OafA/YrhL